MRVRRQDARGDMVFGGGLSAFWIDRPEAPAQVVKTRLGLFTDEWFLDRTQGTPWRTEVLGKYTGSTRDPVIKERTLGTPEVKSILAYSSNLNRDTRAWSVQMTIKTAYGVTQVELPL